MWVFVGTPADWDSWTAGALVGGERTQDGSSLSLVAFRMVPGGLLFQVGGRWAPRSGPGRATASLARTQRACGGRWTHAAV